MCYVATNAFFRATPPQLNPWLNVSGIFTVLSFPFLSFFQRAPYARTSSGSDEVMGLDGIAFGLLCLLLRDFCCTADILAVLSSLSLTKLRCRPARPRGLISVIGSGGCRKPIRWSCAALVSSEKSFLCFTRVPAVLDRPTPLL